MARLERGSQGETEAYSCVNVLDGAEYVATFARVRVLRRSRLAPAFVLPGYLDSHRHLPHGWKAEAGPALRSAREHAASDAEAEGVASALDMGVGVVEPWPSRPPWVTTAIAGLRDSGNRDPIGFGIPVTDDISDHVHRLASLGASLVKIFVTGSGRRPRRGARVRRMSQRQIAAAVTTARGYGLPVVAHCHGGPALGDCLDAGVLSVEHGLYLTRAELKACREANARLTLTPGVYIGRHGDAIKNQLRQTIADALAEGVRIQVGTDTPHETLPRQITWLVELGVPPETAIAAGTVDASTTTLRLLFSRSPVQYPDELLRPAAAGHIT